MQYRTLGRTGLKVSLVSYGSGGPSKLGQNTGLSPTEQDRLIQRCLDLGINFFDTSEAYGDSEAILGRTLSSLPEDSYVLATKCRYKNGDGSLRSPDDIERSVEASLRRLNTDCVDIMQFHVLNSNDYFDVVDQHYPVLKRLQEQGKIRFIGFSEHFMGEGDHKSAVLALKTHPELWDTIMLKYGILNLYAAKEALPLALEHDVGIINMAAVRVKLPQPDLLREQISLWKQDGIIAQDSLPQEDPLGWLVHDDVDSVIDAAYKFAADHPAISTVLTGTSSVRHLEDNVRALEIPTLPEADKRRIREVFGEIAVYI
ncbi:MAG: aldo/keto reductase [Chloroflexi bacterium]|nr:aldo/keto reductase [Chloroflexota bacterium]